MRLALAAVGSALALAGPALAQSSVTLYGVVDIDGQYIAGHSKGLFVTSGGLAGSRLGFKGTEDLGDGLYADFVLEGGLNLDTGGSAQGGNLFGRQAFVDLRSKTWGTLGAGRQYGSVWTLTNEFSVFGNTSAAGPTTATIGGFASGYEPVRGSSTTAALPAAGASAGGPARIDNSVRYTTPSLGGVRLSALYGAGEIAGDTWGNRILDTSARYASGPFDLMLSLVDDKAGPEHSNAGTDATTTSAAASWTIAPLRLVAGYVGVDDKRPANLDGHGFWVGADYRIGSNLLKAQFLQNKADVGTDNETNAYGIGWQYDFSRRTALYTSLARFQNGRGTGLGRFNGSIPTGTTTRSDNDITEAVVGMRHSF
jgi:predicted porin